MGGKSTTDRPDPEPVPNRERLRREYLRKKAGACVLGMGGSILREVVLMLTVVCACMSLFSFLIALLRQEYELLPLNLLLALFTLVGGYTGYVLHRSVERIQE